MSGFPTRAPIELEERPPEQQWLVDTLWGEQAVGIVGGEPKCKSILALDLAVAVAAGVPCLRHFAPAGPGAAVRRRRRRRPRAQASAGDRPGRRCPLRDPRHRLLNCVEN